MTILGIETSCDETAAAIVADGRKVLSNVVYTQIPLHQPYGGVVPEIASRAHIEKITEVVREAISAAGKPKIDAVAVTFGPGLAPALIVGLNAAKGLALAMGTELIPVNHIEAHLHTPFLIEAATTFAPSSMPGAEASGSIEKKKIEIENGGALAAPSPAAPPPDPTEMMPALGLAVSGGHTNWIDMPRYGEYETIGQTLDDAAGEAFDKAAKLLGLGYPGGPVIDRVAKEWFASVAAAGKSAAKEMIPFPQGRPREGVSALAGLDAELCVSFSGLKTALVRYVEKNGGAAALAAQGEIPRVVASYQEAIIKALADRTARALKRRRYKALIVGGGVSLNSRLRETLSRLANRAGVPLLTAKPKFCGDNGAMIAALAYYRRAVAPARALHIDVTPSLAIGANFA